MQLQLNEDKIVRGWDDTKLCQYHESYVTRTLQKCTTFGGFDSHLLGSLKSLSNIT